ncbi:MAG: S-layer homology domain-containing protein, partial [Sedimentibacter sp.]
MIKKSNKATRIKLLVVCIMMFSMMFSIMVYADTTTVTESNDWAANGWARIHEDYSFQQDVVLKRGELVSLINSLFNFKEQAEISFTDVESQNPYFKEVAKAVNAGYIIGRGNNNFDPESDVTKIEAYIMIARALKLDTKQPIEQMKNFKDASEVPEWGLGQVEALTRFGLLGDKSKVKPFEKLTGAEAIEILEAAYAKVGDQQVDTTEIPQEEIKNNGNAELNLLGSYFVTVENDQSVEICTIEEGFTSDNMIIKLVFDRGIVREYWENNQMQIKLQGNDGN